MTRRYLDSLGRRAGGVVAVCALAGSALAGCGGGDASTVDVLAASSYTDVAVDLEELLEAGGDADIDVRFSFGSSGTFFEQLRQGAPASVVITANAETMRRMEAAGLVEDSIAISRNELIIVTADTSAGRAIGSLDDLASSADAVVVVCASSAPCGAATDELLARSSLELDPASREPNVRATLTKVVLGEADAAIVYRTDARSQPDLRTVEIADTVSVEGRAAAVAGDAEGARLIDVLVSQQAADVLVDAGFQAP